jgi:hypothetical protein
MLFAAGPHPPLTWPAMQRAWVTDGDKSGTSLQEAVDLCIHFGPERSGWGSRESYSQGHAGPMNPKSGTHGMIACSLSRLARRSMAAIPRGCGLQVLRYPNALSGQEGVKHMLEMRLKSSG